MRIACIGECMVEIGLPSPAEPLGHVGYAGDTFNTAIYLKRAAPQFEVSFVTAIGTDPVSTRMLSAFAAEDLDCKLVARCADRRPGVYAISLDDQGERSFTYWRDQSAARTLFQDSARLTVDALSGFDLIYLSGITVAILSPCARSAIRDFLRKYRAGGGLFAFDSNYRPRLWGDIDTAREETKGFWNIADIALPSIEDEMALFGDATAEDIRLRLSAWGLRRGALKRGAFGPLSIGPVGELSAHWPAARVVDTTAAGDSFNGAYLAAALRGENEASCMRAGHAMATKVIGHHGAIIAKINV